MKRIVAVVMVLLLLQATSVIANEQWLPLGIPEKTTFDEVVNILKSEGYEEVSINRDNEYVLGNKESEKLPLVLVKGDVTLMTDTWLPTSVIFNHYTSDDDSSNFLTILREQIILFNDQKDYVENTYTPSTAYHYNEKDIVREADGVAGGNLLTVKLAKNNASDQVYLSVYFVKEYKGTTFSPPAAIGILMIPGKVVMLEYQQVTYEQLAMQGQELGQYQELLDSIKTNP